MQMADSIVNTSPDSAVVLLEQLKDSILSKPKSTQMYYHLLSIKAKDKAYIPHTSDSLILQVIHYYEEKEDEKYLPEAYYYAGRIYRDLGDAPQALDYFQKTIDLIGEGTNYKLYSKVYSQMGTLFLYQDIYDRAMNAYKKANNCNSIAKDNVALIFSLRDIGDTFTGYNQTDSALYYYQKAYSLAKSMKDQPLIEMVQIGLASLYKQLKKYDLARKELEPYFNNSSALHNLKMERQSAVLSIMADFYYQRQELDSANYYFNLLLNSRSIYAKQFAHWGLAEIAEKHSNYQTSLEHIHQYIIETDSIQKTNDKEAIRKVQSLYNYQLREKENNSLRVKNARQHLWIISVLFAMMILAAFTFTYIQYSKRKKLELKDKLAKLQKLKEEQYQKSMQFVEENKIKLQKLEELLQNTTEENVLLQKLLLIEKEQIMQMNCKITTDREELELAEIAFKKSDIYNRFHEVIGDSNIKITKEEWQDLQLQIDHCYKDFTRRLRALYPISEIELRICLLLKINITTTGIAQLTGRSKSAIVSARKKLYEKVCNESGKPEQWDAFIASF